jgi:hypothetical protein
MRFLPRFVGLIPPPLTPPLKGEGDFVAARARTFEDVRRLTAWVVPLPLEGRG